MSSQIPGPDNSYGQPAGGNPMGQPPMGQPPMGGGPVGQPPQNYLVWAILSTVCCCLPTGIYSILRSVKVNELWQAGDFAGAQAAAEDAKKWAIIGAALGAVAVTISIIFQALALN